MDREAASARVRAHLAASAEVKRATAAEQTEAVVTAAQRIATALAAGGKVMFCGNGGSAADSQHLAAELTNRLRPELDRPALAALALTTDTSFLTSNANDYGFEQVFRRQVEALGRAGDVLVAISTSGNSANVIRAVEICKPRGIATVGFLGGVGGKLAPLCDVAIRIPSTVTAHIQEGHITVGHVLCELIERELFP